MRFIIFSLTLMFSACYVQGEDWSNVDTDTDTEIDTDFGTDTDVGTDTEVDTDPDTETDTDPDSSEPNVDCMLDGDADGYPFSGTMVSFAGSTCPQGFIPWAGTTRDCNDNNGSVHPGAAEVCDGVDNNCDGNIDEGVVIRTWFEDQDGDGYGDDNVTVRTCAGAPTGFVAFGGDCDDKSQVAELRRPGLTEVCDDIDNDCDGVIDDGADCIPEMQTCFLDADGDGYGRATSTITVPVGQACPSDYSDVNHDCNDVNGSTHPGAAEVCDDIDNDCDGNVDEGLDCNVEVTVCYRDADSDGFGDPGNSRDDLTVCSGGWVGNNDDCNDASGAINPAAEEQCDAIDHDCDGVAAPLEGCVECYSDADADGYGAASSQEYPGECPTGWISDPTGDCLDSDYRVNPGRTEICGDGIDNNCSGVVDEGCEAPPQVDCYVDADGDGYGRGSATRRSSCLAQESTVSGDCDDTNASIHPGATEVADLLDNDCDSSVDEGISLVTRNRWFCDWDNGRGDWEHGFRSGVLGSSQCRTDGRWLAFYPTSAGGQLQRVVECHNTQAGYERTSVTLDTHPDARRAGAQCTTLGYASATPRAGWKPVYRHASSPFTMNTHAPGHGDVMWSTSPWEADAHCDPDFQGRTDDYPEHGQSALQTSTCAGSPVPDFYVRYGY